MEMDSYFLAWRLGVPFFHHKMITAAMATQLKDRTSRSRIGSFSQRPAFKKSKNHWKKILILQNKMSAWSC